MQKGKWPQQGRKWSTWAQPGHGHMPTSGILCLDWQCAQLAPPTLGGGKKGLKSIGCMKAAFLSKETQKVFDSSGQ